jgi:hypothetical protein
MSIFFRGFIICNRLSINGRKFLKNKIKKKSKMRKLRKTVYASERSQGGLLEPLVFAFIG